MVLAGLPARRRDLGADHVDGQRGIGGTLDRGRLRRGGELRGALGSDLVRERARVDRRRSACSRRDGSSRSRRARTAAPSRRRAPSRRPCRPPRTGAVPGDRRRGSRGPPAAPLRPPAARRTPRTRSAGLRCSRRPGSPGSRSTRRARSSRPAAPARTPPGARAGGPSRPTRCRGRHRASARARARPAPSRRARRARSAQPSVPVLQHEGVVGQVRVVGDHAVDLLPLARRQLLARVEAIAAGQEPQRAAAPRGCPECSRGSRGARRRARRWRR